MPVPAPVRFDVNDADVARMWKTLQRQRHGVASPALFVVGVLFLRPTDLRFSDEGLDFDVAFAPPSNRYYPWRWIRRIEDIGDSFVIVTRLYKRIVLPKRSFPDGGSEAWAFIIAHGVTGRVSASPVTAAPA
jgi:hypothetical protein